MPSPLRTDISFLHRRVSLIIARQLAALRRKQFNKAKKKGALLTITETKQLKILADALDDQIRTRRMLEADLKKDLEKLPDERLEELANSAPKPESNALQPPATGKGKRKHNPAETHKQSRGGRTMGGATAP